MFAPNILVVENKRVVLGEVCRNLSVAFAEVHPSSVLLSSSFHPLSILLWVAFDHSSVFLSSSLGLLLIILSAFSLFLFSFCTLFFLLFILPVPFGRIFAPTR